MWHRKRRRRLGVTTHHRKALLRNLVRGLALNRQIETTLARAKEASRLADRMVTIAKTGTLFARRELIRHLGSPDVARLFIEQIAPRLQDRNGGYTRVLKTGFRPGDGAQKALLEFSVPIEIIEKEKKAKKEKAPKAPKPAREKATAPKKEEKKDKPSKEKIEKKPEAEKPDTEKRGGFLSKLRRFLTGDEEKK
ncbi:MAG: 50S ribosomal protein L17 [Candidatus Omnitrophica bacterium]|nr:50S ribosomal protein L17 [Candidatus Omnitrophota bacterium]